jgi:DNA (cytosine-5)-methyltransferase 1
VVTPLRIGALFAGYGGLDMAVESVLESEVAWVSEFDAHPSRILAHRYPHAPNLGDVTKLDWSAVEPVDIITGGSPCQDLSHAGKRAGMKAGTRSGLWASMCDAIDIIRPRLVLWENVRGALSAEAAAGDVESCEFCVGGDGEPPLRALGRVLGDLAELGYDAAWTGLRAADVGAPHGRWRVFVLAWPAADADDGLHVQHSRGVEGAAASRERRDSGPDRRPSDRGRGMPAWGSPERDLTLLPTPAVNDMGAAYTPETWDAWTDRMRSEHGNGNGHGKSLHIEALRLLPTPEAKLGTSGPDYARATRPGTGGDSLHEAVGKMLPTPRATDGTKGGPNQRGSSGDLMLPSAVTLMPTPNTLDYIEKRTTHAGGNLTLQGAVGGVSARDAERHGLLPPPTSTDATVRQPDRWGQYTAAITRWEAILGRPAPAPTEPTGKGGAHRLSPAFVEWLMGLPSGWVTDPAIWEGVKPSTARNAQLKALGNGVVPQQAAAALRHLLGLRSASLDLAL